MPFLSLTLSASTSKITKFEIKKCKFLYRFSTEVCCGKNIYLSLRIFSEYCETLRTLKKCLTHYKVYIYLSDSIVKQNTFLNPNYEWKWNILSEKSKLLHYILTVLCINACTHVCVCVPVCALQYVCKGRWWPDVTFGSVLFTRVPTPLFIRNRVSHWPRESWVA